MSRRCGRRRRRRAAAAATAGLPSGPSAAMMYYASAASLLALLQAQAAALLEPPTPAGVQAFYILFSAQVDSPEWPHQLCQNAGQGPQGTECVPPSKYRNGVFIASPQNMTKDRIAKVKRDVPGSKVVVSRLLLLAAVAASAAAAAGCGLLPPRCPAAAPSP